ncbi:O-antigen ligase domain-containing protein [Sphingobacteriales bacterium UPWRP_1]|nr:hypothetical protein B6N25_11295 [Sphingobacteriales bacterium TSM_CSS]PSJ72751.1 O-antigen ligase domain-containing protein [Sphingobacteriales bacterium UPWRP_1]
MHPKHLYQTYAEPAVVLLSHIGFMVLTASLPLSKGTSSVTMVIMLGFSLLLWTFTGVGLRRSVGFNKLIAGCWLLFAVYVAGLLYTAHLQSGIQFVYKQGALLCLPFIMAVNRQLVSWYGALYLKWLIFGTCFAAVVTTGLFLLPNATLLQIAPQLPRWGLLKLSEVSVLGKFGFYSPFIDRLSFSYLLGISALSCCWLAASGNMGKWAAAGLLGLLLFTAAILGGRAAQLGLLAGLLVWLSYVVYNALKTKPGKSSLLLKVIVATGMAVFGVAVAYGLFKTMPAVWERYNQLQWELSVLHNNTWQQYNYQYFTTLRRLYSWQNTWQIIAQHPLTGVGTGDYRHSLQQLYSQQQVGFEANAHNQFLQVWATLGIGGLLLFAGLLWLFHAIMRKAALPGFRVFGVSVLVFYLIIFTFDSPLNTQVSLMTFVFLLCLLPFMAGRNAMEQHA